MPILMRMSSLRVEQVRKPVGGSGIGENYAASGKCWPTNSIGLP